MRAAFDAAVNNRELADNPVAVVPCPRVEVKEAEYLTPEQVKSLLEAASGTGSGLPSKLLVNTGLRRVRRSRPGGAVASRRTTPG